jgi:hypothetical protein
MIGIVTVHFNYILITYSAFGATSKLNMSVHWPWFCTDHECVLTKNMLSFRGKVLGFRAEACYSIFSFICMFCRSFCPFVLFLLAIVLSVLLRYTDSDCPFRIFKLFFPFCRYNYRASDDLCIESEMLKSYEPYY